MDKYEFSQRIFELRTQKGISQKELGELLGVSNKAVSKWENGESIPKTQTLVKISEVFGIDIGELMGAPTDTAAVQIPAAPQSSAEMDSLRAENAALRSQVMKNQKSKHVRTVLGALLAVVAVCAACIFAFFTGGAEYGTDHIRDAGKDGTKIEMARLTFTPPTALDTLALGVGYGFLDDTFRYNGDLKEAVYTDLSGKQTKIAVCCEKNTDYIAVVKNNKSYYYINDEKHLTVDENKLLELELIPHDTVVNSNSTFSDSNLPRESGSYVYHLSPEKEKKVVHAFVAYYNNKKETADKRATELFLGNEGCSVRLKFAADGLPTVKIGEFFTGKEDKLYFYDYADGKTYDAGKEMAKYVKAIR